MRLSEQSKGHSRMRSAMQLGHPSRSRHPPPCRVPVQLALPRLECGRLCHLPGAPLLGQLRQPQLQGGSSQLLLVRRVALQHWQDGTGGARGGGTDFMRGIGSWARSADGRPTPGPNDAQSHAPWMGIRSLPTCLASSARNAAACSHSASTSPNSSSAAAAWLAATSCAAACAASTSMAGGRGVSEAGGVSPGWRRRGAAGGSSCWSPGKAAEPGAAMPPRFSRHARAWRAVLARKLTALGEEARMAGLACVSAAAVAWRRRCRLHGIGNRRWHACALFRLPMGAFRTCGQNCGATRVLPHAACSAT